jgi:UDP-N-acetylglucosamine--N-acetylmuramyl-(pentapeptide) pyrophosphoryl-undecaprenol N-acetylglucosamine transferase
MSFKKQGFSEVIEEEYLTKELLIDTVNKVFENRENYITAIDNAGTTDAVQTILDLIDKTAK